MIFSECFHNGGRLSLTLQEIIISSYPNIGIWRVGVLTQGMGGKDSKQVTLRNTC